MLDKTKGCSTLWGDLASAEVEIGEVWRDEADLDERHVCYLRLDMSSMSSLIRDTFIRAKIRCSVQAREDT